MRRQMIAVWVLGALASSALVQGAAAQTPPAVTTPGPTAEAFGNLLVAAVNNTLTSNPSTGLVALQGLLERALEAVFVGSNVAPAAAKDGVEQAAAKMTASGVMCALPAGPATKRCEAVALAYELARKAASDSQGPTATTGGGVGGLPLGAAGLSGGGGGGGVTHPPVTGL